MANEPENILLVYLRRLDEKMDRIIEDVQDVKRPLTSLEAAVAMVHGDFAGQSLRIDRIETRLDKIDRRLDIGNA